MEKNKKRKDYESPKTTALTVELEGNFCGSAGYKGKDKEGVNIKSQDVVENTVNDFSDTQWGEITKTDPTK